MKAYALAIFFAGCLVPFLSSCQYDPDRVSDGDSNAFFVEYRKIYNASSTISPDSTLVLLNDFLSNPEFENYPYAWNLKAYTCYQLNEFDQSLTAAQKAMEIDPENPEFSTYYLMSKMAIGKSCEISSTEINNSVYGPRIAMWSNWLCKNALPSKETITKAYPVSEQDSANYKYQRLCFQLIKKNDTNVDESLFKSLKNTEHLKVAVLDYIESPDSSNLLSVYRALR